MITFNFKHSADDVLALFQCPEHNKKRCLHMGDSDLVISYDGSEMETQRTVSIDAAGLCKGIASIQLISIESWDCPRVHGIVCGTCATSIVGRKVSIVVDMYMTATMDGCYFSAKIKAKAQYPIIGKAIEKAIIDNCASEMVKALEFTAAELDGAE